VLWGKAEDLRKMEEVIIKDFTKTSVSEDPESQDSDTNIRHPLLTNKSEREI
jgi:hypothetical protein